MRKRLFKAKDRVATEDKDNIIYETDCNNCEISTSVNLNRLGNYVPMNTKYLSGIAIVKIEKLLNTAGKQITTLAGIRS